MSGAGSPHQSARSVFRVFARLPFAQPLKRTPAARMSERSFFSLGQAAKLVGRSKSTLSKAIRSGRLSVTSRDGGSYQIDAAELFRVFAPNGSGNGEIERSETPEGNGRTAIEAELAGVRNELEQVKSERDDLRRRLDDETQERRRLTAILTDQRVQPAPAPSQTVARAQSGRRIWLWRWRRPPSPSG